MGSKCQPHYAVGRGDVKSGGRGQGRPNPGGGLGSLCVLAGNVCSRC